MNNRNELDEEMVGSVLGPKTAAGFRATPAERRRTGAGVLECFYTFPLLLPDKAAPSRPNFRVLRLRKRPESEPLSWCRSRSIFQVSVTVIGSASCAGPGYPITRAGLSESPPCTSINPLRLPFTFPPSPASIMMHSALAWAIIRVVL